MAKYHVNPATGKPGICVAQKRTCVYGGESGNDNHYNSAEEASAAATKMLSEKHGSFSTVSKKSQLPSQVSPGEMVGREPITSYEVIAHVEHKLKGRNYDISFRYQTKQEALNALTGDARLTDRFDAKGVTFSVNEKTEKVEYIDDFDLADEKEEDGYRYVVDDTKFLKGRMFGHGGSGSNFTLREAKQQLESAKQSMFRSSYPEAKKYNPDTQTGMVVKVGRVKVETIPINIDNK